jgi:hypothetical protein
MNRTEARRAAIESGPLNQTLPRAASALRLNARREAWTPERPPVLALQVTVNVRSTAPALKGALQITHGHRHTADPADPRARRWRVHTTDPTISAKLAELFNPCRRAWFDGADSFFIRQGRDVADLAHLARIITAAAMLEVVA